MGSNIDTYGNFAGQRIGLNWSDAQPPAVPTAINATFDTGPIGFRKISGWSKVKFSLVSAVPTVAYSGYSVQVFGTDDLATANGTLATPGTGAEWISIPAPSGSSGDPSNWTNPLTATGQAMFSNAPWVAFRCVVTAAAQTGSIFIVVYGTP